MSEALNIAPFSEVVEEVRRGRMVIMTDDAQRENEGDLMVATECVTAEQVAFMMQAARGLICVSVSVELATRLNLPLQVVDNNSSFQTPFAVSIDWREALASAGSAAGRAAGMRHLVDTSAQAEDFLVPGHIFPLIANPAGVLGRQGQTEGSYDLARIAGFTPSGVICEILNADGSIARGHDLNRFAETHGLKITTVEQVAQYRIRDEVLVREVAHALMQTDYGEFIAKVFKDDVDGKEHLAMLYGYPECLSRGYPLVRIHSECLTGDVFGSQRCDCRGQLDLALAQIVAEKGGMVLYLRQEGRGIGLSNKLRAYALQDAGDDTVEANVKLGFAPDLRNFAVAAKILSELGVHRVRLLTNNPNKMSDLERFGIGVVERVPIKVTANEFNYNYLETKREKMGHFL
ncbi:MAG: GTP cyclohydrolase II [Deltaproteobacteria bacterium]|nr:GTP cyclohydrolase II [Deltaproteobacteria bacterium]